ncbi:MAG: hypothetical protein WBZ36_21675 [Candidatus Nitrosopolaris sp.]
MDIQVLKVAVVKYGFMSKSSTHILVAARDIPNTAKPLNQITSRASEHAYKRERGKLK